MQTDLLQQEYWELWRDYGLSELPRLSPTLTPTATAKSREVHPLLFVGEPPTEEKVASEQLLQKIIEAMGYSQKEASVFFATPQDLEKIKAEIIRVHPRVVVALGSNVAKLLTGKEIPLSSLRGKWATLAWDKNYKVMPTFPPEHLLKNPLAKKTVWEDMKLVKAELR